MIARTIALSASILWITSAANANRCDIPPVCDRVRPNSILFVGLVLESSPPADDRSRDIRIEVQEVFAGLKEDVHEVNLVTEANWLLKGHVYLIDAYHNDAGKLTLGSCGASQDAERAIEFLTYLRERKKGNGETSLTVSAFAESGPVADVQIRISGPKGEREATIGTERSVRFSNLEPGKYSILATKLHYEIDPDQRSDTQIEVFAHACPAGRIRLKSHANVSGIVKDAAGKAISELAIEMTPIIPADYKGDYSPASFQSTTDAEGRFTFEGVLPGRYYLGINLNEDEPDGPLPRTYYPGRRTAPEAVPIAVDAGAQIDGLELWLPDYGKRRQIMIRVVDQAGNPVEGAEVGNQVSDFEGDRSDLAGIPADLKTGKDGLLITEGYEAARYVVDAFFRPTRDIRDDLMSETSEIKPGKSTVKILLVLKR